MTGDDFWRTLFKVNAGLRRLAWDIAMESGEGGERRRRALAVVDALGGECPPDEGLALPVGGRCRRMLESLERLEGGR